MPLSLQNIKCFFHHTWIATNMTHVRKTEGETVTEIIKLLLNAKNKIPTWVKVKKLKLLLGKYLKDTTTSAKPVIRKLAHLKLRVVIQNCFWSVLLEEFLCNYLWRESFKYSDIYIWHLVLT